MNSIRIFGDSGDAPSAKALGLLASVLTLALLAIAGLWADPTVGDVSPVGEPVMGASGEIAPAKLPPSQAVPATLRWASRLKR
jgi:hypothetical protein